MPLSKPQAIEKDKFLLLYLQGYKLAEKHKYLFTSSIRIAKREE
ncbi:hypothetical protein PPEP_b0309 [Pseudoalteromonas peptidolytica F12-50-A1]|uniref:Uncharacterized protein n=1 Tax=Pseudoalteromonas peptidolytica F12-50-A1 TaxID=1315280 RepID=A0A8I0T5Z2_9GAMM|nr:hypothetical protein [Pseudoalteromonas peptidolytica F12-50-A1]